MTRFLLVFVVLIVAAFAGVHPVKAQALDDTTLDEVRAGYTNADGLKFSVGAVMKSYLDGSVALESRLSISDQGMSMQQQLGPAAQALSAEAAAQVTAGLPGGLTLAGDGGATTFLHNFGGGQWTNMAINSANGRQIVQDTAITIGIPNLPQFTQQMAAAGMAMRLQNMLGNGLVSAAPH